MTELQEPCLRRLNQYQLGYGTVSGAGRDRSNVEKTGGEVVIYAGDPHRASDCRL